jgi:iron complex transport system substrate-binding protein
VPGIERLRLRVRHRMRALIAASLLALAIAPARADDPAHRPWPDGGQGAASGGVRRLGPPPPDAARRVVSLGPSMTDIVIALGHADRLVGVTRFDTAPEVAKVPRVGGFLDPSAEAVLGLRPDLVLWLTDGSALPAVRHIAEVGVPVLAIPVISVADVVVATRTVAQALGDPRSGERLAKDLEGAIARTRARAASLPRRRVLLVVGREPLVVAGPGSYPDELLRIVGAENVVGGAVAWPVFPLEKAAAADPDLVIDAAVNEHGGGGAGAALSVIPAVRRGAIRVLRTDDVLRPGPRLVRALDVLFASVHPEAARE